MPGRLPAGFSACAKCLSNMGTANTKRLRKINLHVGMAAKFLSSSDWKTRCTSHDVFRLDKEFGEQRTRLMFDGQLSTECIELLEKYCEDALKNGKPVDLILRDVTGVDAAGQALLRRLAARGVCLFANGVYMSYLLDNIHRNVGRDDKHLEFRLR
jgi:hypothetical protein